MRNGFSESEGGGRVVGGLGYLKRCLLALPVSLSGVFFIVRYFSARLLFSLVRTDREPDTG